LAEPDDDKINAMLKCLHFSCRSYAANGFTQKPLLIAFIIPQHTNSFNCKIMENWGNPKKKRQKRPHTGQRGSFVIKFEEP